MRSLHLVFNLSRYSGAAFQAKLLGDDSSLGAEYFSLENSISLNSSASKFWRRNPLWVPVFLFKLFKVDILHMHGFSLPVMILAVFSRKPIILKTTLQGSDDFSTLKKGSLGGFRVWLINRISVNVCLTSVLENENRKHIAPDKIMRIPNGVEVDVKPRKKNKPIFCTVGIFEERKGILESIAYFDKYYGQKEGAELFVIGPDPIQTGIGNKSYFVKCKNAAGKNVKFLGMLDKSGLKRKYQECLGFIFFSKREGMPNVLLEAMAQNCVPVVGEIGGMAGDVVENRIDGFIALGGDGVEIDDLITVSHSLGSINKVNNFFDIKKVRVCYFELYSRLLK